MNLLSLLDASPSIPAAVVAASIAGLVSVLALIISKEQKTSEFRQAWIDALRADVAAIIAHSSSIFNYVDTRRHAVPSGSRLGDDFWKEIRGDALGMAAAMARVRLRLNASEILSQKVLQCVRDYDGFFSRGPGNYQYDALKSIDDEIVESTSSLLKEEWNRVKRGEDAYRFLRNTSVFVTVLLGEWFFLGFCIVLYMLPRCLLDVVVTLIKHPPQPLSRHFPG